MFVLWPRLASILCSRVTNSMIHWKLGHQVVVRPRELVVEVEIQFLGKNGTLA